VKSKFGFNPEEKFVVPKRVYDVYRTKVEEGKKLEAKWAELFRSYSEKYPKEAKEIQRRLDGKLPEGWKSGLPKYTAKDKPNATRSLSQDVLNAIAGVLPELVGGSADLTPSTKTNLKDYPTDYQKASPKGRYFRYGVREHGMAAIGNGIHAYGGIIPYTSTFFNFITYAWGAVRLSAISGHQQIYVMTHDSIGLGEDGPTHQPVEAIAICRATPNISTIRPADGNETAGAYVAALENHHGPTVIALSRQNLPHLENSSAEKVLLGGYVAKDAKDHNLIYVATGSEVAPAIEAAKILESKHGLAVRVVSMPSTDLFDKQPVAYRRSILTPGVPVISVEASSTAQWARYSHHAIGMSTFGASAPLEQVYDHFGFTPAKIVGTTLKYLKEVKDQAKSLSLPNIYPLAVHFQSNL
jgi:transketolase